MKNDTGRFTAQQVKDYCSKHGFENPLDHGGTQSSEFESPFCNGSLAEAKRKGRYAGKCLVSITSYRARLTDPDNLCAKYFLDSLRYAGLVYDDSAEDILYQISQKKTASKKEEKTLIQITYP